MGGRGKGGMSSMSEELKTAEKSLREDRIIGRRGMMGGLWWKDKWRDGEKELCN